MGFWVWFLIWAVLVIGALYVFASIGLSLLRKVKALEVEASKMQTLLEPLLAELTIAGTANVPQTTISDDPEASILRVQTLKREKIQRKRLRANRLVKDLKSKRWEKP